jgi:phosphoglycerate dehydrogenase-like enzyme
MGFAADQMAQSITIKPAALCCTLQGIGMNPIAYDIAKNPVVEQMGVPYMSIEDMLPIADVVSLHVPLLPSTYHIMNKPRWASCWLSNIL